MGKTMAPCVSALVCAAGMSLPAAAWEVTSAVEGSGEYRTGFCTATLPIGLGGVDKSMRVGIDGGTVWLRQLLGEDELKPLLFLHGFGPHHTRSRTAEIGLDRCSLVSGESDSTAVVGCVTAYTEHRVSYRMGREALSDAWLLVGSDHGTVTVGQALSGQDGVFAGGVSEPHQYSLWWDYPEEIFATDDRQVLEINAGGNSRADVNGLVSPSGLRIELWDSLSVMRQLQRCADRHMANGLLAPPFGSGASVSVLPTPFNVRIAQ